MILCGCARPVRDTSRPDRLHCDHCQGWTPHGRPVSADRARRLTAEARSLATQLGVDLPYVEQAAYGLSTPLSAAGKAPGHSDPTLATVAGRRAVVAAWATLSARMAERAVTWLRWADEAAGNALLAAEGPRRGPDDHVPAPYHDPATLRAGRPDLAAALDAQARRRGRGEL